MSAVIFIVVEDRQNISVLPHIEDKPAEYEPRLR